MCRSIKTLRQGADIAAPTEVEAAALQYVRKVSGFRAPSPRHRAAFDSAVADVAQATARLLAEVAANLPARPLPSSD